MTFARVANVVYELSQIVNLINITFDKEREKILEVTLKL